MSAEKEQVMRFYEEIWNNHDKSVIPDVLHESFQFRGSLGPEKQGHKGFIEYLDMVHAALGDYRCEIKEMISEESKVFAKMQFSGKHQGEFMGFKPTGRILTWAGAALFNFKNGKALGLWVLGDIASLQAQLNDNQT